MPIVWPNQLVDHLVNARHHLDYDDLKIFPMYLDDLTIFVVYFDFPYL